MLARIRKTKGHTMPVIHPVCCGLDARARHGRGVPGVPEGCRGNLKALLLLRQGACSSDNRWGAGQARVLMQFAEETATRTSQQQAGEQVAGPCQQGASRWG